MAEVPCINTRREILLLALHVCDKGQAEACPCACCSYPAVQRKVALGHTKLHTKLGFEALWVLFCPGWCPLAVRKKACVRGMKKASERRRTAARGKGANQRLAKKSQTKGRVPSSALPCPGELQELEVMLASSGVKMQSLGLDPWLACTKKAGGP